MKKIKKNCLVKIITGNYKGKIGKVLKILNNNYIIVKNINLIKKHMKLNNKNNFNIITKESKIHISNVLLIK